MEYFPGWDGLGECVAGHHHEWGVKVDGVGVISPHHIGGVTHHVRAGGGGNDLGDCLVEHESGGELGDGDAAFSHAVPAAVPAAHQQSSGQ